MNYASMMFHRGVFRKYRGSRPGDKLRKDAYLERLTTRNPDSVYGAVLRERIKMRNKQVIRAKQRASNNQ